MDKELEVMRVLRVPPMGKLVVEFRGNRYEQISDVEAENVGRLLLTAVGELISFAGGYQNLADAGVAPPLAPSSSSAANQATAAELNEKQARFLNRLESQRDATKVEKKQSSIITPGIQKIAAEPSAALSPVAQIDSILQRYIAADPELADRSVHLTQHPAGGLQIEADGRKYQRPREIEDQRVQILIKKAIKEWEGS
ncbi:MAG: hypothetical protein GY796_04945 [Chloroflexi bacterium]|nr:hypothetical protein [Chloroflexota bacterium]